MTELPAVVLAAGSGTRIGKGPKALLTVDGATFLERVIGAARYAGCAPVIAVIPPGVPELHTLAHTHADRVVVNAEPEVGMFRSVQLGLDAVLSDVPEAPFCLLLPVDHPHVEPATIVALLEASRAGPGRSWIRPVYRGRGGHPILLATRAARGLAGLAPGLALRDALRAMGEEPTGVPVEDPGILRNINELNDLS